MKPYIKGTVEITVTDLEGNLIDHYGPEDNMVLDTGVATMWQRLSTIDSTNLTQLDTIALGDDYGDPARWSIFNPEPPAREFTEVTQNATYSLPAVDYTFPLDDALRVVGNIEGSTFMEANFPFEVDYRFSSMTLRFNNGTAFAYKRFPIRSISRHVRVTIDWRFTIVNAEEHCAPQEQV